MSDYALEALLRPPVELYAAATSGIAAAAAVAAPEYFMMTPSVSLAASACLGAVSYRYTTRGMKVLQYQKSIKRLSRYSIKPKNLTVSDHKVFLGKGFRWQTRHTQRVVDCFRQQNETYVTPSKIYKMARRAEIAWEKKFPLSYVAKALRWDNPVNPVRPWPDIGGYPFLHGVGVDEEEDLLWALSERNGHCLVLGTTRVGKTRLEELIVAGDIRRGNNVVIVIDPKGDGELFRRMYIEAERAGRASDFYFFHLGYPDDSCRYNPVGDFQRSTEVAGKTTSQLADGGNSAAFKALSWRFVNLVAQVLIKCKERPTIDNINYYVQDLEDLLVRYALNTLSAYLPSGDDAETEIDKLALDVSDKHPLLRKGKSKKTIATLELCQQYLTEDSLFRALSVAVNYEREFYNKLVASLLPFLDKMNSDKLGKLLSPEYFDDEDPRPILNWREVIQRKGIVYIGLDALTDREVATAVGNSMFNDVVSTAGLMYKHGQDAGLPTDPSIKGRKGSELQMPELNLHADEFNSLVGDEFVPMVNQGGGAGVRICAYTQNLQDIDAKFGTSVANAKSMQIVGNFNTLIMLRVQTEETAGLLASKLPKVDVRSMTDVSGAQDKGGGDFEFTSSNQDRINDKETPMINPSWLMGLPKGHAFMLMEGNILYKVRFPLWNEKGDSKVPKRLSDICNEMKDKYRTGDQWWKDAA